VHKLTRRAALLAPCVLAPCLAHAEWLRDDIVVYAEPPLRPVIAAMAAGFGRSRVRIFCAAPGQMLALLGHGTQDDILIAQSGAMNRAVIAGLTTAPGRKLWRNRLVFAAAAPGPPGTDFNPAALRAALAGGRLALPDPSDATTIDGPALLQNLHVTGTRTLGAFSTADAVGALKRGEATLALCHISEAATDPTLRVAMRVPDAAYDPITYAAALSAKAWSRYQEPFLAYLAGPAADTARSLGLELLA